MIDFSKVGFEPAPPTSPPGGPAPSPPPVPRFTQSETKKIEGLCNDIEAAKVLQDAVVASESGAVVDLNKDGARRAIQAFSGKLASMRAEAKALVVNSVESAKQATEMVGQVKRLAKAIDERRKEIIAESDSFVRFTNGQVKPLADELKDDEAILKRKLADYACLLELQRREIERRQNEARIELQKQVDAEAKAMGVESVVIAPVAMPTRKEPVRSDSAVSSAVMVWKHEVIDAAAVPREYLMVDDFAIKAAVKAGIRSIPGVRVFEDAEMRVRRVG